MLRPEGMEWLVDAFNGGELTALEDAEALLGKLTGYQVGAHACAAAAACSARAQRQHFAGMRRHCGLAWRALQARRGAEWGTPTRPTHQVKLDPKFLSGDVAISSRALLLRLLNNLRQIYMTRNEADAALTIIRCATRVHASPREACRGWSMQHSSLRLMPVSSCRYMQATVPAGELPELRRDEGLCLFALGRYSEAAALLAAHLADHPDGRDSAVVAELLQQIRKRIAGD